MMDERHDTIFDEEPTEGDELAHVDFDLLDTTGRWFLKVLSGPNTGAEFSMQSGSSYLVGTDTATCDIVFQDLSVSRQHARIAIDAQDHVAIEDLNSRNGTFIDGDKLTGRRAISSNVLVTMGTTTFMLIDREGERQTIVSPLAVGAQERKEPPIAGAAKGIDGGAKKEGEQTPGESLGGAIQQAVLPPLQSEVEKIKEEERKQARLSHSISALVILAAVTGLFVIIGVGTTLLFKTEEIPQKKETDADTLISQSLKDYPNIRYSYNPTSGKLLLIGHVLTPIDRSKILDSLQDLSFISSIDYSNIIIDEYVWREINQVIAKNPAWKSITISSPAPGKFILSGFLKTKKQAEDLYDYVSQNFSYPDLLEKRVVVEEDLKDQINQKINEGGFRTVTLSLTNGQLVLSGTVPNATMAKFNALLDQLRTIPGVRTIQSLVTEVPQEETMQNISNKYEVTGYSVQGTRISVVIDGKILQKGNILDGMEIIDIQPNVIYLKDNRGIKYRIDFNR